MKSVFLAIAAFSFGWNAAHANTNPISPAVAAPLTQKELSSQIEEKAKQLENVTKELEVTKANLKNVKDERVTLQRELKLLDGNIAQLNLNLKADEIQVQKLNLEIDSLRYELDIVGRTIEDKRDAVEELLLQLHIHGRLHDSLLRVLLTSKSLADGVFQAQTYRNLEQRLIEDIESLKRLHADYEGKLSLTNTKRGEIGFHKKNLEGHKAIIEDQKEERQSILAQTKNKESVFERQVAELEKIQQQIASEVEALDAILRAKIDPSLLPRPVPGVLLMPIAGGRESLTQDYGATQFARYGYKGRWHNGIDIGAPVGTPIFAAEDGVVAAVGDQDAYCRRGAYGKFVAIAHANNLVTLSAHLSRYIMKKGDNVKRGQVIGYSGRTGYATGPHLHFTVYAGPTFYMGPSKTCGQMPYGGDLDPLGYL